MDLSSKYPRIGVACVVEKEGKILLGKRRGAHGAGYWATPGGHLEFGETVESCAARELLEETGLKAQNFRLGPWVEDLMDSKQKHYITLFVLIQSFEEEPALLEPDKCYGWDWFSLNRLPQPLFLPLQSALAKDPNFFLPKLSDGALES